MSLALECGLILCVSVSKNSGVSVVKTNKATLAHLDFGLHIILCWVIIELQKSLTSLAASCRLQNAIKYCTKVRKPRITKACRDIRAAIFQSHAVYDVTSCFWSAFIEVRKSAETVASDGLVCIKVNAVLKASSNFSSLEYRQRFRIKWRGVSPSPTLWWASCYQSPQLLVYFNYL